MQNQASDAKIIQHQNQRKWSVIICEIIVQLSVTVQNNKSCRVHY
jgi:hypothetical protein